MKKIHVLGTGCPNCERLAAHAESAARELGIDYEIEKVTEIDRIIAFGIMATPGLAIDGEVKCAGRVPPAGEIKGWLEGPEA